MNMLEIEKSARAKIKARRSFSIASLESMSASLVDSNRSELFNEIFDICFQALSSSQSSDRSAERAGELIASVDSMMQSNILGDVQNTIATCLAQELSPEEMLWLQPFLIKILTDMSNGYYRVLRQNVIDEQQEQFFTFIDQIEKSRLELNKLRLDMDTFVSHRTKEFMETNLKLEKEIREHKKARAAMHASEHRYRTLAESAHDYIYIINKDDKIEYCNKYAKDLFRTIREDIVGANRSELFHSDSNDLQHKILKKIFETGTPSYRQEWTTLNNGKRVFLDTRLVPLIEDGHVRAVLGISRDLTEQKQIEERIADREKKYHTLFDTIYNAIFLLDECIVVDCNQSATRIFDIAKGNLVGRPFYTLFVSNDAAQDAVKMLISQNIERCILGEEQRFELDYIRPDSEKLNFELHFSRFPESDRWQVLAVIRNITQYKKANEAIRASESRFRDIIQRSIDGYFFIDVNYRLTHLNPSGEYILGYSKEELNKRYLSDLTSKRHKKLHRVLKQAMGGTSFEWEEFKFTDKNVETHWIAANVRRVYEKGIVTGVEGFIKDITHRKKSEIDLIENEARYRALFENTPYDVFGLTLDRNFLKINQNFLQNWGEFEGKKIDALKPQRLARLITELCDTVERLEKTREMSYSLKKAHVIKYYRIILAPIITQKDKMIGFVGLIIDTTDSVKMLNEKKTFAEKLIQTSEEEQRRISRDIHDSFGQMLFALQLDISAVKEGVRNDIDQAERVLEKSQEKLSMCIKEASDICYRLSPKLLEDFGLVEALEDLFQNIESSGMLKINFERKWSKRKKAKSLETALFRVTQEALANVLKHAKASMVRINLKEKEKLISLTIADDGVGFHLQAVLQDQKRGFGLINMKERIEIIGGDFAVSAAPGKGTTITISLPLSVKGRYE
ncbi:PAS domain S-box protein [candidate division KSB1 bacterium]|nr:PAS domain S-box protein [candidate division KSB1 bacterium]